MKKRRFEVRVCAMITASQRALLGQISREVKKLNGVVLSKHSIIRAAVEALRLRGLVFPGKRPGGGGRK
ncbi:MAG: hypothetical protein JW873_00415 [Candidatus Saganbacteria bacterium]|nr:hypothetical protein [Candidatus Saganbacteria bacterium]